MRAPRTTSAAPSAPFRLARAALLALVGLSGVVASPSARAESTPLRVINYNVQFLPGPGRVVNKRKPLEYRAEELGRKMAAYDVVGLQETFDDMPRELLLGELKKAWGDDFHVVVHPKPEDENRFNGGLLIASRTPILAWHHSYYTVYSDPKEYGVAADGFAAKGGLHARIARTKDAPPDDFVDVFVTHLEARADQLRPAQYEQFAAFVREHSDPNRPALLMGDMNTGGLPPRRTDPASDYNLMLKRYADARPGCDMIDLWPALKGDALGGTTNQETTERGNRIDYVFVSNPIGDAGPKLVGKDVRVNFFQDPKTVALSDHNAVEADFDWTR